jgi:kynurenine formamidase
VAIADITGPIYEGMWTYGLPYAPFRMEEVPPVDWVAYPTYSQNIAMNVQTGTYLETEAHMFPGKRTIDQLRPEELFLDAQIIHAGEKEPGSAIAREDLGQPEIPPGSAILVCTGWGRICLDGTALRTRRGSSSGSSGRMCCCSRR